MERALVPESGIPCYFLPMGPPSSPRAVLLLLLAAGRAALTLRRLQPRAVFATGGYTSTPAAVAAWLLRVPVVLFLPDVVPGRAISWLAPIARRIAVSTDGSLAYLPAGKTVVTGYPVRDSFRHSSRAGGRQRFHLPEDAKVLLAFGGSLGSRRINQALAAHLPEILATWHVLHVCGEERLVEAEAASINLSPAQHQRYHLFAYLDDDAMAGALAASDLALCRSGGSTLGELPATGTPAILVPLPQVAIHQRGNADYLVDRGAAILVEDERLEEQLYAVLDELHGERLLQMSASCAALDRPDAAGAIVELIDEVSA